MSIFGRRKTVQKEEPKEKGPHDYLYCGYCGGPWAETDLHRRHCNACLEGPIKRMDEANAKLPPGTFIMGDPDKHEIKPDTCGACKHAKWDYEGPPRSYCMGHFVYEDHQGKCCFAPPTSGNWGFLEHPAIMQYTDACSNYSQTEAMK